MEYYELNNYSLRVVNFKHIFDLAYKNIVEDLFTYDIFHDYNVRMQDTKRVYYYHLIKNICDYIVRSSTSNRLILYVSMKDINCNFIKVANKRTRKGGGSANNKQTFDMFMQRFLKQVKNVLPIKVYNADVKFNTFVQYFNNNKGRYIEMVSEMKQCRTNTVNMEKFKKFSDKYKLNYLTKHYVDNVRVKCMLYK